VKVLWHLQDSHFTVWLMTEKSKLKIHLQEQIHLTLKLY